MIKLAFVSGSRADFGLMKYLIRACQDDSRLHTHLIVTGSHLSDQYGRTISEIDREPSLELHKINILHDERDDALEIVRTMGRAIGLFAEVLDNIKPDYLIVLGDRYEAFAAAQAAFVLRIPIVHLHGGERTEGALDDVFRNSISLMATLHFTANQQYADRLIQMGIEKQSVYSLGSPGIDELFDVLDQREQLLEELPSLLNDSVIHYRALVTFHSVTAIKGHELDGLNELIEVMRNTENIFFLVTGANADHFGMRINQSWKSVSEEFPERIRFVNNLGRQKYLQALKQVDLVVGNSSSGIIEAPYFGVPTVNIGVRQGGRLRPRSVIDCGTQIESIQSALQKAVDLSFRSVCEKHPDLYGSKGVSEEIKQMIVMDFDNQDRNLKR